MSFGLEATTGPVRPARGSMPQFYREVTNLLIDQGWTYIPRRGKSGKHRLIPPDPTKRAWSIPSTPSDSNGGAIWVNRLSRSGAIFDEATLERLQRRASRSRLRRALREQQFQVEVDATVTPISTRGQFWHPEPEPEPPPEPEPEPPRGPNPDDAVGTAYTLGQAREMLRQGYHILKVVQRTGWGANHLRDLVDNTGYFNFNTEGGAW